ncbi:MAG: CoA transferase [Candidatus Methylomirabilia bacterium]
MPGPLDGIRVVELAQWVAAPAAGAMLADWGAEVIHVEPPVRVQSLPEVARDPQAWANEYFVRFDHPVYGKTKSRN